MLSSRLSCPYACSACAVTMQQVKPYFRCRLYWAACLQAVGVSYAERETLEACVRTIQQVTPAAGLHPGNTALPACST